MGSRRKHGKSPSDDWKSLLRSQKLTQSKRQRRSSHQRVGGLTPSSGVKLNQGGGIQPISAMSSTTPSTFQSSRTLGPEALLSEEEWVALARLECYHGLMPRDEIESLLEREGDFLVRKSEKKNEACVVLSVRSHAHVRHFVLKSKQGMWYINDPNSQKKSIHDLILYLVTTREPIYSDGTVLLNGVPRPSYYLLHEQIKVREKLGDGAFGEVFACDLKDGDNVIKCAAKTLKGVMAKSKRVDFIREARLMRQVCHRNILRVYGVAPQNEPLMIVFELCSHGSLKSHLQKASPSDVTQADLACYCLDVAQALEYLTVQKIIHRDVAARNCLLGKNYEVKLSDFGLSVVSDGVVILTESIKFPTRWLAPETINNQEFSSKSDVWAYGVLMWEIYSRCETEPYPGLHSEEVRQKILSPGQPMEAPSGMPPLQDLVMRHCFIHDKRDRISFSEIVKLLTPMPPTR